MELLKKMRFPKRYSIILLTFICTRVCYLERIGFSIAYTAAADSIGVNQSSKGLILSVFYYGYVVSQVSRGWVAQYVGGRRVLLFSFLLWSLTCALAPLDASKVNIMVYARFLVGVAQGFIFPSIHTILVQWVPPHERSRFVSLTTSGMYLGAAGGMLVLPSLVKYKGPQSVFMVESALGIMWSFLWFRFSSDPVRSEHPKAAAGFGEHNLPVSREKKIPSAGNLRRFTKIPWKKIIFNLPIWAIVVNNFTFHYALYVLMNWLPTYFELGLQLSLQGMGSSKMIPYFNMFIFSNTGGILADHLITRRFLSVSKTQKLLNTIDFVIAALALMAIPLFRNPSWTVICSSISLGFLALGRAGFAVNHMDVAPQYAGIVMGVLNTAGTLAGIVGVGLTGRILEAAKSADMDLTSIELWKNVFLIPAYLCIFSSFFFFLLFTTGEKIFE
ncbi:probable anion transporter 6 isoform X1 [Zingiber officinale]|uniref:probable anion transporter 6 isoform X1 n=1 Tax=Zingiber officinale TaxID=94328 RepID=UPI001C4CCDAD|nr:probable anion transporter 6 isoform X1 [Zingiber officinale]